MKREVKRYEVVVKEMLEKTIYVDAFDIEGALETAENLYDKEVVVLDGGDWAGTEIDVVYGYYVSERVCNICRTEVVAADNGDRYLFKCEKCDEWLREHETTTLKGGKRR